MYVVLTKHGMHLCKLVIMEEADVVREQISSRMHSCEIFELEV